MEIDEDKSFLVLGRQFTILHPLTFVFIETIKHIYFWKFYVDAYEPGAGITNAFFSRPTPIGGREIHIG